MGLVKDELEIKDLKSFFDINLEIPEYQRPYRWTVKSANTLFDDTYQAFKLGIGEYRLGSVILHKDKDVYKIVDGQQRLTTLALLFKALGVFDSENSFVKNISYSESSFESIIANFRLFKNRIGEIDCKNKYIEFLKKYCKLVQIVVDNEEDAFLFFDSQNTRGKELKPHDLLKCYHLREMNED